MKVEVDPSLCQGYGICAQLAPEVFELDDDGYASVDVDEDVIEAHEVGVRESVQACPVRAVLLHENT